MHMAYNFNSISIQVYWFMYCVTAVSEDTYLMKIDEYTIFIPKSHPIFPTSS